MKTELDLKYQQELELSFASQRERSFDRQWHHLERAHILGQFHAFRHFYVHILMIRFSIVHFEIKEFLGQIPRIILAIPGSITHLAPKGNTGGSDVGIFTPMTIPEDIANVLEKSSGGER